jgi:hypothetical protein
MPPKKNAEGGKNKKGARVKPECIPPESVEPLDQQSLEFYLIQIADYENRVDR